MHSFANSDPIPTALKFTQPARVQPDQVEQLRAIMLDSFNPSEHGDFDIWVSSIAEGKHWLYLAEMRSAPIGFATITPWISANIHLLEFLAISREYRNRNYGAALLQHVIASLRALGTATGIILEVDSDEHGPEAKTALKKRRIGFYKRNGAHIVKCAPRFRVPSMIPGDEPLHEKLMWIPFSEQAETPGGSRLRDLVIGLYTMDYGRAADDELLLEILDDLDC